jgi:hypothetical protein
VLANERNASTGQRNAGDIISRRDIGRWAAVYRKQAADGNEPAIGARTYTFHDALTNVNGGSRKTPS